LCRTAFQSFWQNVSLRLEQSTPRFEALRGDRNGQHSIRINGLWRICFDWQDEAPGPSNVEIVDYR